MSVLRILSISLSVLRKMIKILCILVFTIASQTNSVYARPCKSVPYTFFYTKSEVYTQKHCKILKLINWLKNSALKNVTVLFTVPELKRGVFQNMPNLQNINVSNANLDDVHTNAFLNLPKLEIVLLRNNSLNNVRNSIILPMKKEHHKDGFIDKLHRRYRGSRIFENEITPSSHDSK